MADTLRDCAAARKTKDFDRCKAAARQVLKRDSANPTAWAYLCWALFEQREYEDASAECLNALAFREWDERERAGMAALRSCCRLLAAVTGEGGGQTEDTDVQWTAGEGKCKPKPGELLRSGWYTQRLTEMIVTGQLLPFPLVDKFGGRAMGPKEIPNPLSSGGDHRTCSLMDFRENNFDNWTSDVHDVEVRLGEGSGERRLHANMLKGFPYDQATGGNVYLRDYVLAFHCDRLTQQHQHFDAGGPSTRKCYGGLGPCGRCIINGFPIPTHPFPVWEGAEDMSDVRRPNDDLDVLYSTTRVSPSLRSRLQARLDELAQQRQDSPMPMYHNVIDPNLTLTFRDRQWMPTEFDVCANLTALTDAQLVLDAACARATGQRLPFGLSRTIVAELAGVGHETLQAKTRSPIPGMDPHKHHKLLLSVEALLSASLPLLAALRKPSLLLPGPLQVVVKAQRIVLAEDEEYSGLWHEDGMNEHVAAVVLFYHRASPSLQGGALEFCSKQTLTCWKSEDDPVALLQALPRCQVPVEEGTLVVFSNFEVVHRVLRMLARGDSGSRDFMALFVIDQRRPLPSALPLSELQPAAVREEERMRRLEQELRVKRGFGIAEEVYSTGNGRPQDLGWVRLNARVGGEGGGGERTAVEVDRIMNLPPPRLDRGLSAMLMQPPREQKAWVNPESQWEEQWIGDEGVVVYVDRHLLSFEAGVPTEGVSVVKQLSPAEFWDQGLWTTDTELDERLGALQR